jgi:hypothetical protein
MKKRTADGTSSGSWLEILSNTCPHFLDPNSGGEMETAAGGKRGCRSQKVFVGNQVGDDRC